LNYTRNIMWQTNTTNVL